MKRYLILLAGLVMACQSNRPTLLKESEFGGELYTLKSEGVVAQVTPFGARVVTLFTQDKEGQWTDIVAGHNTLAAYEEPVGERFFGATVGPVANRIGNASFQIEWESWHTDVNDHGVNTLHGGSKGFDMRPWKVESATPTSLTLSLECPNGQEGFPGNRLITLTYSLEGSDFKVDISGTSTKVTPMNIAHHPFFCLSGEGEGSVEDYIVTIAASAYTPIDSLSIPTGEIVPVEGTPFDFRTPHTLGERINEPDVQLQYGNGYDHNWCLDGEGMREVCRVEDPASGRTVTILTDQKGLQLYSGNFFNGSENGKNGKPLGFRSALVLEAQGWPDAVNHPEFPSIVPFPGEEYHSSTIFRFGAE